MTTKIEPVWLLCQNLTKKKATQAFQTLDFSTGVKYIIYIMLGVPK